MNVWGHPQRGIPTLPKLLAVAAILPLVAGAGLLVPLSEGVRDEYHLSSPHLLLICQSYTLILTAFLSGIYWGVGLHAFKQVSHRSGTVSPNVLLLWSLVVGLISALSLLDLHLAVLALMLQWLADIWLTRQGFLPQWWLRLRTLLSPVTIAAILLIAQA